MAAESEVDGNERVAAFFDRYLENRKRAVAFQTWLSDAKKVANWIIPTIGQKRVEALRAIDVEDVLNSMQREGCAARTIQMVYQIMNHAFRVAVTQRILAENPCRHVPRPRWRQPEINPLTREQVIQFVSSHAVQTGVHGMLFVAAIYSGCREGELLGLRWEDVNFEKSTITIAASLAPTESGALERKETKTKSGRRTVSLPSEAMDAFSEQRKRMLAKGRYGAKQLVFQSKTGRAVLGTCVTQALHRALKLAGVPQVRFHDLRHTHATIALQAGVNVKVLQERLGHGSIKITLDTYGHVLPNMQAEAASKIQAFMRTGG